MGSIKRKSSCFSDLIFGLFALMMAGSLAAQAIYPERPIRLIVSIPTGGSANPTARVAQHLPAGFGHPVVVNNSGGDGVNGGNDIVAKVTPDGQTLLITAGVAIAINPRVYAKLPPYAIDDVRAVTQPVNHTDVPAAHPAEHTFAQASAELLSGLSELGERHRFSVAMEIRNGNGNYVLHIKQRHNRTTEHGLLHIDLTILSNQESIQGLLRDLRRKHTSDDALLPVFSEGVIAPVLNFVPIRANIEMLRRKARHADEYYRLLREYYGETFLRRLEEVKIPELAAINFLIAQALVPSGKNPDFLYVDGISSGHATPDELALMAGGATKLHALGEVMLIPTEGKEEITNTLALVFKEGREFFDTLSRSILEWAPAAEHEELLALLRHSRSMHQYQMIVSSLEKHATTLGRTTLLNQFHHRAIKVTEAVFIARERKTVERIASYLGQSSHKLAPMVFGVDHNFIEAITEWNNSPGDRLGLVTFTHSTETESRGRK